MDIEDNIENKPSDKPKFTGGFANVVFKPKNEEEQKVPEGQQPAKKIKKQATEAQLNHPLHGVKLAHILESLVEYYGWPYLESRVKILCFKYNPTIKASLAFLRKMDWARAHVQDLYIEMLEEKAGAKGKEKFKKRVKKA